MGACWKDYRCPTKSVWSCIVLTLTASVFHGTALIFHYWTDHETFCEIDLLKRNETCRVQQGLWEYCEKYKKLGIELCSYGMHMFNSHYFICFYLKKKDKLHHYTINSGTIALIV